MSDNTFDTPEVPWGGLPGQLAPARRQVSWGTAPVTSPAGDAAPAPAARRRGPAVASEPAAAPAAPAAEGAVLADLFDDGDTPAAAAPDLADLFDAAPDGPTPAPAAAADLGDLFDDGAADAAPALTAPHPSAPDLGGLFDDGAADAAPDLGALFDGDTPTVEAGDPPAEQDATGSSPVQEPVGTAPVQEPVNPPVDTAPVTEPTAPAAEPADDGRLSLAARRAALAAAHVVLPAAADPQAGALETQRFEQLDYYYHFVDRILALGQGGDPDLQALVRHLELTRDKQVDAEQRARYQQFMEPRLANAGIQIRSAEDQAAVFDLAYDELIGIGPLGPLWREDDVTEIKLMGWDRVVVERNGKLEPTAVRFRNAEHAESTARQLAQKVDDRALSPSNPLVTAQLPGARVQFVYRPLVKSRLSVTIRKFRPMLDMATLLDFGSLSEQMASFLHDAVAARATVLVSGGTGSGKTTFVNALSEFIPDTELVITIEDALELQLRNSFVESLLTKEAASADDQVLVGQDALLKATLRMRPDRIIVGEIRDGSGASVMLQAANTGHDGTMTTIHANSPELALTRMANLLRRVDAMPVDVALVEVVSAINVVVQVVRKRGRRYVSAISVVHPDPAGGPAMTQPVFVGEFPRDAEVPLYRQVAALRPDTELAIKMSDAGVDPAMWELT